MKLIHCPRCRKDLDTRMYGHHKVGGFKVRNSTCKLCQAYFHNAKAKASGRKRPILIFIPDDSLMFPGMKAQPAKIWQTGMFGW